MRNIKNKTYFNFMLVMNRIIETKGYDKKTAEKITCHIFDEYNPYGKSIESMIDDIMTKDEYEKEYGKSN